MEKIILEQIINNQLINNKKLDDINDTLNKILSILIKYDNEYQENMAQLAMEE